MLEKNKKKCPVCGKEFPCSPSAKTVTCSPECKRIRRSQLLIGKKRSEEAKKKISATAKKQDRSKNLSLGTPAAMQSEKAGRSPQNSSAKNWTIQNINTGQMYSFSNLQNFIRDNSELFDVDASDENVVRISHGFYTIKRNLMKGKGTVTYKDWQIIYYSDDINCRKKQT